MGVRSGLFQVSAGYLRISRYFFLALAVSGLLGTVTGVFGQSQQPQLTLTLSNLEVDSYYLDVCYAYTFAGTVSLSGSWNGGPLHFEATGHIVTDTSTNNFTIQSNDFAPQYLNYPSSTSSNFETPEECAPASASPETGYYVSVNAYDSGNNLVGTVQSEPTSLSTGSSSANLFILTVEIPLFQVPALGISASNPDFSNLFATFDQLPLGDFYMLLAEVSIILLVGAGLINIILYLTGESERQRGGTAGTLAGISNTFATLLLVLLLPYAYNAVAGFVNVLDQQIIAGPGNPYTAYLANSQLIWNTLPTGGNILTDFIGAIASLMAWVMSWLLGSARIFLIGAVTVAMPIVLVLRNIRFTARFAGVVEDTFFGLIFASVISALFVGLAAYTFNHWNGSMFQAGAVDKTWVALAALMGAILAPTVFAPMTGVFFQTMSQIGMAAAGTAVAIGAGGVGPGYAGMAGGISAAGQALGGLAKSNPNAGFMEKAGTALGGFGGAFGRAVPHMAQNMVLMGTVGTLGGLGASRSASAINRAIDLKMPGETQQAVLAHRADTLVNELKLGSGPLSQQGWKALMQRAFSVGVHHDMIRMKREDAGNDLIRFRNEVDQVVRSYTAK